MHELGYKAALSKLGVPQYFLGIEVHYQGNGSMALTQTKYVRDLLAKINMVEEKGVNTLMFSSCELKKHDNDKMSNSFLDKSTVEAL